MELATKLAMALQLQAAMAHIQGVLTTLEAGAKPQGVKLITPEQAAKPAKAPKAAKAPAKAPKGYEGGWPKAQTPIGTEFKYTRKGNGKTVTFKVTGWDAKKGKVLAQRA